MATPPSCLRTRVVSWAFFSVLGITPVLGRDFTEADGRAGSTASRASRATRSGSSASAAAPMRSASRFASTAPTTRVIGVLPPALGPLERRYDLFLIQQFTPPHAQGPVLLFGDRPAAATVPIARWRPASCTRSTARCSRSGSRRIRTTSRRGPWRISRPTWSATSARSPASPLGGGRAGVADRVRERVEPADRARHQPAAGTRRSRRPRRLARARGSLPAGRERLLAAGAGAARHRHRVWRHAAAADATARPISRARRRSASTRRMIWIDARARVHRARCSSAWFRRSTAPAAASTHHCARAARRPRVAGVRRLRRGLVAAQFAIATPLLIVAGLLLASLNQLKRSISASTPANVLTGSMRLPAAQYREPARIERVLGRAQAAARSAAGRRRQWRLPMAVPPNTAGNTTTSISSSIPPAPGSRSPSRPGSPSHPIRSRAWACG